MANHDDLIKYLKELSLLKNRYHSKNKILTLEDLERKPKQRKKVKKSPKKRNSGKPLAALEEVFLEDGIRDEILLRLGVPELLRGSLSASPGVIFYGPSGTGKSVLARAYCNLFEDNGAYSNEVSVTKLNSSYVGKFARNLMMVLDEAKDESAKRGLNSLLFLDEADSLIVRPNYGASSVSKGYQEAINELKKQLEEGNNDGLTMILNTNENPQLFEPALIRPGRLSSIEIGFPSSDARTKMWQYFSEKYGIANLTEEQARELSELTPEKSGASIADFCRGYMGVQQRRRLTQSGTSIYDALNNRSYNPDESTVVGYDELRRDVSEVFRQGNEDDDRGEGIGFHTLFFPKE